MTACQSNLKLCLSVPSRIRADGNDDEVGRRKLKSMLSPLNVTAFSFCVEMKLSYPSNVLPSINTPEFCLGSMVWMARFKSIVGTICIESLIVEVSYCN